LTLLDLKNSFLDFNDTTEEKDSRIKLSYSLSYKNGVNWFDLFYEKGYRMVEDIFEKIQIFSL